MRRLPLTIISLSLAVGCELTDTVKPLLGDGLGDLKDAIVDIDPAGLAKDQLCKRYMQKGRELAENAWTYEWPKFATLWDTPVNPAADMAYCQGLIRQSGAEVVTKKSDSGSASAVCFQAQFPKDFGEKSIQEQAAITCHEAAHILEQERVTCKEWNKTYFTTISGRLTFEGTAYVLMRRLLVRYGWTEERAERHIRERANRFPESYLIPREIISDECTMDHWNGLHAALRERTGL